MVTVYRIQPDVDKYQFLMSDDFDLDNTFDGLPKGDRWKRLETYSLYPLRPEPFFWTLMPTRDMLAVKTENLGKLQTFIDESCELLPVSLEGVEFSFLNVVEVINNLDKQKSQSIENLPHIIQKYAFHPKRFTMSLFKIPETRQTEILCVEHSDSVAEFKGYVEKLGLTGLRFKKLWTDEQ